MNRTAQQPQSGWKPYLDTTWHSKTRRLQTITITIAVTSNNRLDGIDLLQDDWILKHPPIVVWDLLTAGEHEHAKGANSKLNDQTLSFTNLHLPNRAQATLLSTKQR